MSDHPPTDPDGPEDAGTQGPWDAAEEMRQRADTTRRERDQSIAELRSGLDDERIRDEFGIDLDEIER